VLGSGLLALVWLDRPVLGIDTLPLLRGTESLAGCLGEGALIDCRPPSPVDPFPLLQHAPDLVAHAALGLSDGERVRGLASLSVLAVAASVVAAWAVLRRARCPEWRWVFLIAIASGPVVAYGNTTWGETLATGLLTLLVAAAFLQVHPGLLALAAFGAGLTKETGYPFVVALGVVGLVLARHRTGRPIRLHLAFGAGGVGLAVLAAAALNLLRFGDPRNTHYLDPQFRTPTPERTLEFAAGLVVAPSGGIVVFWPVASILVVLLLGLPIYRVLRRTIAMRDAWPALALVAVLAGLLLGLAFWWVPFGWAAWGPRLSLPWVLPVLLLSLAAYGPLLRPIAARAVGSAAALVVVAAAMLVVVAPHVGYLWRYETVPEFFERQTARCPVVSTGPSHYACIHEQMWTRRPIWIDALPGLASSGGALTLASVGAILAGSLVLFRRELRG